MFLTVAYSFNTGEQGYKLKSLNGILTKIIVPLSREAVCVGKLIAEV